MNEDPNNINTHLSISTICIFMVASQTHTHRQMECEGREGGGKEGEGGREEGGRERGRREGGGGR